MKYAYKNGKILNGTKDMQVQTGLIISRFLLPAFFIGILAVQPGEAWTHAAFQVRPFLLPFRWRLRRVSKLSA